MEDGKNILGDDDCRPEATTNPIVRLCDNVQDYRAWDNYVFDFPGAHYFQTYGWLKSYQPMGLTPHVLVNEVNGIITGGVAFLTAKLPLLPWSIFIIPHGPLTKQDQSATWMSLMKGLDRICRKERALYAQLYPHEVADSSVLLSRVDALGFTSPAMFSSHRFTSTPVIIDLTGKTEDHVIASFRPRTRQYVKKALASDLVIRTDVDENIFNQIYELFMKNGKLMGYTPRPYMSVRAVWDWFAPMGYASFIQAWRGETLVGAILLLFTGRTAYYLAGAFQREFSEYRPAEFLHWHGIREAITRRLDAYDFVNTVSVGVEQFKRGFRPTIRRWHDPRTKLYYPLLARTMSGIENLFRPVIRKLGRSLSEYRAK